MRLTNPFDASEVFEFPPGTSEAEARDSVGRMLIERAMEREKQRAPAVDEKRKPAVAPIRTQSGLGNHAESHHSNSFSCTWSAKCGNSGLDASRGADLFNRRRAFAQVQ